MRWLSNRSPATERTSTHYGARDIGRQLSLAEIGRQTGNRDATASGRRYERSPFARRTCGRS